MLTQYWQVNTPALKNYKLHFDGWALFGCTNCLSLNLYCLQLHWYIGSIQFGCWAESKCKSCWHMIMCKKIMQELTTNKRMILRWLCCAYISAAFSFRIIFHGLLISQSRSCCWNLSLLFTLVNLHPTKQIALIKSLSKEVNPQKQRLFQAAETASPPKDVM